jgi:type II restriction/modification system DNA methylase subunit YeeA
VDAERLGIAGFLPRVDLKAVRGIEIDSYAAELARLTLWIGYLQWLRLNAASLWRTPCCRRWTKSKTAMRS